MILKAGPLSDLQDARYCAAEGIPYLSFSLERGSFRKVAPGFITDVATWISGPVIVADYGVEDSAELILEECTQLKINDICLSGTQVVPELTTWKKVQLSELKSKEELIQLAKMWHRIELVYQDFLDTEAFLPWLLNKNNLPDNVCIEAHPLLFPMINSEDKNQLPDFTFGNHFIESGILNYELCDTWLNIFT